MKAARFKLKRRKCGSALSGVLHMTAAMKTEGSCMPWQLNA
jgi:hypothetical protein